jgi:hypothetical protein
MPVGSSLLELPSSPSGENGRAKVAERQTRLTADQLYPGSIPGLGFTCACLFRCTSSVLPFVTLLPRCYCRSRLDGVPPATAGGYICRMLTGTSGNQPVRSRKGRFQSARL